MASFRGTLREIQGDLPGGKLKLKTFLSQYLYKARFRVLLNHRLSKYFFETGNFFLKKVAERYRYKLITRRNCDISFKAIIGKGVKFPHPLGIVIGDGVVIKDNVVIYQQVTFGSHGKNGQALQYPVIEQNVRIYAGAKIIGGITIGENSVIGANSLINKSIPPNSIAYGIPCKIIDKN